MSGAWRKVKDGRSLTFSGPAVHVPGGPPPGVEHHPRESEMYDEQPDWEFWTFVISVIGLAVQMITQVR